MIDEADVLIIGGGIHGSSAAFHLARLGITVSVIEKDYVGRHASGVNAGGVRTLGRDLAEIPLALLSKRFWLNINENLGDDCGFNPVGHIRLIESDADLVKARHREAAVAALGLPYSEPIISQEELFERLPAVSRHCLAASFVENDGYAIPYRATIAFRRAAARSGAKFHEGKAVRRIEHAAGKWIAEVDGGQKYSAPILLNCAGAWAGYIAAQLGDSVPLKPNGSMMVITNRMPHRVGPVVGAMSRPLSFKQFPNGTVLLGGGHRAPVDTERNLAAVNPLALGKAAETAMEVFPFMRDAYAVRFWSGIEGFMPDNLPVIGKSARAPNAYHAFGFSAHGFQLGPGVGKVISDLIMGRTTDVSIDAFRIDRAFNS